MESTLFFKTTVLSLATLLLASCGQPPLTPERAPATFINPTVPTHSPGSSQAAAFGLLTPAQAAARLQDQDLKLQVRTPVPTWAAQLLDVQGRFLGGTLHAGVPIALTSPVAFTPVTASAAEDTASLPELTRHLIHFGDAALVPLLLGNGDMVGLLRLPLYPGSEMISAAPEYVLFERPTATIVTAQAAAVTAGLPGAKVLALALDMSGHYAPFNFGWLVAPTAKGGSPTLVSPELPTLVTQRGERILAAAPGHQVLAKAQSKVSVAQASAAMTVYIPEVLGSPTDVRSTWTQK